MTLLFVYLGIALVMSFLCSLIEATLLSITASHASIISKEKPRLGKELQHLKSNVDKPLAAILTVNTFAHTIGAAGVGAQAQILWGDEYLTIVSIVLTVIILIVTEIIPKTIGANYWKQLTPFTVGVIKIMIFLLYPIVLFSQLITKALNKNKETSVLSRADFSAMAEIGSKEGALEQDEYRIISNILRFNLMKINVIMTPRTVVVAASKDQSIREFYDNTENLRFSRIPIYGDSIDDIMGYVLKDEILQQIIEGNGDKNLASIVRRFVIEPESANTARVFERLIKKNEHIALVVDEYGGTSGIVSMEDIIETLLGLEITDESDDIEDLQKWARENWKNKTSQKEK
ncbi:MAG: CNNM domain-containing protein [Sphingobacterium sp.]